MDFMDSTFFAYLVYWVGVWSFYIWLQHRWYRHLLTLEPAAMAFIMSRTGKTLQALAGLGALMPFVGLAMLLFGFEYFRDQLSLVHFSMFVFFFGQLHWTQRLIWKVEDRLQALQAHDESAEQALGS